MDQFEERARLVCVQRGISLELLRFNAPLMYTVIADLVQSMHGPALDMIMGDGFATILRELVRRVEAGIESE